MKDWLPLVAVVIAQFVLVGLYLLKQRADDKRRWHEKRLYAYTDFVSRTRSYEKAIHTLKWAEKKTGAERRELFDRFGAAYDAWTDTYFGLQLLASDEVRAVAAEVVKLLDRRADWEEGAFQGGETGSMTEWMQYNSSIRTVIEKFQAAVRRELGVSQESPRIQLPRATPSRPSGR
ncbi:MAG TPA: hypothetical protein VIP06_02800 [Nocardioides sp.]